MAMDKRVNWKNGALLLGSAVMDSVQGFVLFNMALCSVPSITGFGAILTAICAVGVIGIAAMGTVFSVVWGWLAYLLTGKKLMVGIGIVEAVPALNGLPMFTAASLYFVWKQKG